MLARAGVAYFVKPNKTIRVKKAGNLDFNCIAHAHRPISSGSGLEQGEAASIEGHTALNRGGAKKFAYS